MFFQYLFLWFLHLFASYYSLLSHQCRLVPALMHDVSWKQDLRDFRIWKWTSRISHIPWCKCIAVEFVAVRIKVESIVDFNGCVNLNLVRTNFFKSSAGSWASSIVEFFYFFYYCYPPLWTILAPGSPTNNALDPERLVASSNLEMGLKRNTIYLEMARLGHSICSKRRPTKSSKLVENDLPNILANFSSPVLLSRHLIVFIWTIFLGCFMI